jgi:membrane associated rhomboid family serine protease
LDELPTIVRECRPREELPDKAREQIALMQLKTLREKEQDERPSDDWPEEIWKWIPAVLGLPVEMDANPVRSWSWLTWGLAAAMAVAFALTAKNLDAAVDELGLVPNQFARHGGITFVTSFFLHGGFFHLLSNAYFLLVFGNNVEDDLGRWRYALLIVAAALGGDVLHILGDPRGMVACVGASGGISGIIAFYALRYPHARLGIMWRLWFLFRWFQMPAWAALIVWLVLQAWLAAVQLMGAGQVSALAHLGGCAVGLLAWLLWRAGKAGTD